MKNNNCLLCFLQEKDLYPVSCILNPLSETIRLFKNEKIETFKTRSLQSGEKR